MFHVQFSHSMIITSILTKPRKICGDFPCFHVEYGYSPGNHPSTAFCRANLGCQARKMLNSDEMVDGDMWATPAVNSARRAEVRGFYISDLISSCSSAVRPER